MTTSDSAALARYLDTFPSWLRTLGSDAGELGDIVAQDGNDDVRRYVTGTPVSALPQEAPHAAG